MNTLRLLLAGLIFVVVTAQSKAVEEKDKADNAKLLLGKWEVTKSAMGPPVGALLEFSKDGKAKAIIKKDGKEESRDAEYTVEGDKISIGKAGDAKKETITIKKISETELTLEGPDKDILELKRIK
jgi:uncharacterized protein (TIGR03066 family)